MVPRPTALVMTALELETRAVTAHLAGTRTERHEKGTIYQLGDFDTTWRVVVAETGPGNPTVAVELERAVSEYQPRLALLVGVAGGLKDVRLGDVVAATKIYGYESGKIEEDGFMPRPSGGESTYSLVQLAKFVARENRWVARIISDGQSKLADGAHPRAFIGPIAGGEKVIATTDSPVYELMCKNYSDALAVEMEGYGFARAAYAQDALPSLIVRGISDLLDGKGYSDSRGLQEHAASNAAAFTFELLAHYIPSADLMPMRRLAPGGESSNVEADQWCRVVVVAVQLYPEGPNQEAVWERAGGDLSTLNLRGNGRAQWFWALNRLELGGGGANLSTRTLLEAFREDYPSNQDVLDLESMFSV